MTPLTTIRKGIVTGMLVAGLAAPLQAQDTLVTFKSLAPDIDRLFDFDSGASLSAASIATVNQVLGTEGVVVTRLVAHRTRENAETGACAQGAFELETRLQLGRDAEYVSILANTPSITKHVTRTSHQECCHQQKNHYFRGLHQFHSDGR